MAYLHGSSGQDISNVLAPHSEIKNLIHNIRIFTVFLIIMFKIIVYIKTIQIFLLCSNIILSYRTSFETERDKNADLI